jgi:serine/threonine protein kinase
MLEFTCSSCGGRLSLDEVWAGKKCRCGHCGQIVGVPPAASVTIDGRSAERSSGVSRPPAASPAVEQVEEVASAQDSAIDEQTLPPEPAGAGANYTRASLSAPPSGEVAELVDFLAPPQAPDEIGRLGDYRILDVLGGGGMGAVFLAEDVKLGRMVALKTMLPALAASTAARQRFLREARAAAAIEHDHIVTIYQVGEERGIPFIAMQLLRGESLDTRLQRAGRLSIAETIRIARETAAGLAVAHERGLIHRDIKPSNIWLEFNRDPAGSAESGALAPRVQSAAPPNEIGRVKILDFGLARSLASDSNLTRSGAILGTPAYMAPEQARGRPVDNRADLFSLGCVLYRACTGEPAFRGSDAISTLMAVAEDNPPPPHQLNPDVPPRLSQLIMHLLAKDPAARPASARAVIGALQELGSTLAPGRVEDSPSPLPAALPVATVGSTANLRPRPAADRSTLIQEEPSSGRKWLLIAAVAGGIGGMVLLILLVCIGVLLWHRHTDSGPSPETEAASQTAPAISAELQNLLHDDVRQFNYTKTNLVGFPLAPEFTEIPPDGAVLIGFEFGIGRWEPNDVINSIRAIYLSDKGESFGKVHGTPTNKMVTIKAKKGYTVGALRIVAHLQIDGIRVTFMRLEGKHLDVDQTYSETAGTIGDKPTDGTLIGGSGAPVLGICGRDDNRLCNALGLILRGKVDK